MGDGVVAVRVARGRGREVDRFDQWLEPFYLPGADGKMTKTQFKPEHTFDTKALGYEYDVLHPTPKQNLRQMPYLALFKQVDIATLPTSYQTYIYVYKEGDAAEPPVGPDAETCLAHPNLAASKQMRKMAQQTAEESEDDDDAPESAPRAELQTGKRKKSIP